LPAAKALLDLYGFLDKNGDGWRDMPDGRPLTIEYKYRAMKVMRARVRRCG
jgi:hypothetical protein